MFFKCGGTWEKQTLVVDWSGTANNRVVIGAYYGGGIIGVNGNKPMFDGKYVFPSSQNLALIMVPNRNYVTIENIRLINSLGHHLNVYGSTYIDVTNVESNKAYNAGIRYHTTNYGTIEGCDITDTGRKQFESPGTDWPASLAIVRDSNDITIRKNKVYHNHGEGIGLYYRIDGCIIEDNLVYLNNNCNIYVSQAANSIVRKNLVWGESDGIGINDESNTEIPYCSNNKVYFNLIANCFRGIVLGSNYRINGLYSNLKNIEVYNNTVVNSISRNLYVNQADPNCEFENCYIENNIFYLPDGGVQALNNYKGSGITFSNNLWSNEPIDKVKGLNDVYALPKLIKTTGWNNLIVGELIPEDFMLQPDSPAIDKGIPIDGMTHDFFGTPIPQGSAPDIGAVEYTDVSDPCEGVVCDNICIGKDLWSQKCEGGSCVPDQLIESNSVACGYDPCEGVVCDNICIGNDLWSQKCVDGSCVPDQLIESNSISCGYDPCEGVVCDNVCIGNDLWSRKCVDGSCVPDQLIESNSTTCELCEGVVCGNICVGNDLWSQSCDPNTGTCVANQLLQQDSINCKIPDKVPSDESTINTYIILGGFGLMGLAMLILRKK